MLVQIIKEVPDEIFNQANEEIKSIDWDNVDDTRAKSTGFKTSTAVHLRVHKLPDGGPVPKTIEEWSMIFDIVNHHKNYARFPKIIKLAQWMKEQVNGLNIGRIMIINLAPKGKVSAHIDPMTYFEVYSRYHIPFKTNEAVVFHSGDGLNPEHMPYKTLCRLNNRTMHALDNNGDEGRIHLLVDIEVEGGNQIF